MLNIRELMSFYGPEEQWWHAAISFLSSCCVFKNKKSGSCCSKVCSIHSMTNKLENSRCSTN